MSRALTERSGTWATPCLTGGQRSARPGCRVGCQSWSTCSERFNVGSLSRAAQRHRGADGARASSRHAQSPHGRQLQRRITARDAQIMNEALGRSADTESDSTRRRFDAAAEQRAGGAAARRRTAR